MTEHIARLWDKSSAVLLSESLRPGKKDNSCSEQGNYTGKFLYDPQYWPLFFVAQILHYICADIGKLCRRTAAMPVYYAWSLYF